MIVALIRNLFENSGLDNDIASPVIKTFDIQHPQFYQIDIHILVFVQKMALICKLNRTSSDSYQDLKEQQDIIWRQNVLIPAIVKTVR